MADARQRPLSPHLQVYRWQITMVLSILHRTSGLLLTLGAFIVTLWLVAAASGPEAYTQARELLGSPPGLLVLAAGTFSFFFHLCNGIRHLFWDAGLGFEIPQFYASGWTVVVAAALLAALAIALAAGVAAPGAS